MYGYILSTILAYGGAVAAMFNPFIGLCIYWGFELVRPQAMFGWAGPTGRYSEALALGTLIGWALAGFGNLKLGRAKVVVFFLAAHALCAFVSALASPEPDLSFIFVREYLKVWLMFLVSISLIDSVERSRALAWVIAGSIGYLAAEFNQIYYLRGANYLGRYGYARMDSNSFAVVMVTMMSVCAYMGLYSRKLWQKAVGFGGATLAAHTVMLSFSRGAFLGAVAAGIAAVIVTRKKPSFLVACALGAVVVVGLAGPSIRDEFSTVFVPAKERDGSAQSRVDLWQDCLEVMSRYPILGVGPGRFRRISSQFGWPPGKDAHTLWLGVGAEMGAPALVFLLGFYGTTALLLVRLARSRLDEEPWRWLSLSAAMVLVCLAAFAVSALFVSMQGLESPYFLVALGIATIRLAQQERQQVATAARQRAPTPVVPDVRGTPLGAFVRRSDMPARRG